MGDLKFRLSIIPHDMQQSNEEKMHDEKDGGRR
jgi:hypothetical protein